MQINYILLLSPQELWEYSDELHLWRQLEYMLFNVTVCNVVLTV